jgi:hypothetical protein
MDMDYDDVSAWLRERLGRRVLCSVQGMGNTGLTVIGPLLRRDHGEVSLIDPPPGRVDAWSVGGATLLLLEGDLVRAGTAGLGPELPQMMQMEFEGELTVTVGEVPPEASL